MTNANPSTDGTRTFIGIRVLPISSATATNPMTTASDACPNSSLRVNDGSASHNAAITSPTFRAAPRHMSWLPSRPKNDSTKPRANSPSAIAPTNERFTVTLGEFMLAIMRREHCEGTLATVLIFMPGCRNCSNSDNSQTASGGNLDSIRSSFINGRVDGCGRSQVSPTGDSHPSRHFIRSLCHVVRIE